MKFSALAMSIGSSRLGDLYFGPYYALEKFVASRSIPSVPRDANRLRFEDVLEEDAATSTFNHSNWDAVLREHVDEFGIVDYDGISSDARFTSYLDELASSVPGDLPPLETLALHLNAYNALCVSLILKNRPKNSINEISTKETPVWDSIAGKLGGVDVSLNDVEHRLLRFKWDEPTIHACIVCASKSCPNLPNFAFKGDKTLPDVMRSRFTNFLTSDTKGMKVEGNVVTASRILLWFEDDFKGLQHGGGPLHFAYKLAPSNKAKALLNLKRPVVRYFDYDWSLNKAA